MDLLAPGSATTLALLGFRVGGVVLTAPVFTSRLLPARVKSCVVVLLTWLLQPVAYASLQGGAGLTFASALGETLVGMTIGLGAAILVGAAEAAGELIAVHMGLSGAASLDPLTHVSVPVLGQLTSLFAITVMLTVDGHLVMLEALSASLRLLPVGAPLRMQEGVLALAQTGSTLFLLGVRFAAPVLATVLLANVALAVLTRVAPQLNVLSIAFPLQIGVGLFALAASIPAIGALYAGWNEVYGDMMTVVLGALRGGGGS
jgi:flagellar biosynthetic protein FliR